MNLNPEFQRQLFLECSQARLIGIPLVLAVLFTFSYIVDGHQLGQASARMATFIFTLSTLLWGCKQTVDAVIEEFRERTWDTQRLSALGPWELTWGKWLGSTVMVWYVGTVCWLVYALSSAATHDLLSRLFFDVTSGLLIQGLGLLLGILAARRGQLKSSAVFIGVIVGIFLIVDNFGDLSLLSEHRVSIWHGQVIDSHIFHRTSLLLALFWCAVGNYRLMAQELGLRAIPWIWGVFCLFMSAYLGGFIPSSAYTFALASFSVCSALTYLGVIVENNQALRFKRLFGFIVQRAWRRALEEVPIWWISLLFTLVSALALSISEHPLQTFGSYLHIYPFAMLTMLVRDCGLYLYFCYGSNPERALGLTMLTAVLLYVILPGLFSALGQVTLAALFLPLKANSAAWAGLCGALQVVLVLRLLYGRWRIKT
ncbi:hypothetical protein [Methylomonas sp. HYX-M1]|uniref:hypothetical protein n=1 Tax=Methylomonas sp. HYX-M1 TaxID=3139307 RepID=UPI00345C46A6